jgi:hypothetical protein
MTNIHPLPRPAPKTEFVWVEPDDVSAQWDLVRPAIENVAEHGDHWRPEDVYMALRQGASHLHVIQVDGRYAGCIVTTPTRTYDGPVLHVWVGFSTPDVTLHAPTMAQLLEWARNIKARRIEFASPRRGWERLARKLGFVPKMTVYEYEVAP